MTPAQAELLASVWQVRKMASAVPIGCVLSALPAQLALASTAALTTNLANSSSGRLGKAY
jgi:hypothetical protein